MEETCQKCDRSLDIVRTEMCIELSVQISDLEDHVHGLMKQTSNLYVNSISSDSKSCPKIFHLIVVKRQSMSLSLSLYRKRLLNH